MLGNRPLQFGSAFHEAVAVWWAGNLEDDENARLDRAVDKWHDEALSRNLSPEDTILGRVLLQAYVVNWDDKSLLRNGEPVVERKVELPLLGPDGKPDPDFVLVVMMDVLALSVDGEAVIVEHKTTKSKIDAGAPYWKRTQNNLQAAVYFMAVNDNGHTVKHVLWDVIRAPELARRMATPVEKRDFYKTNGKYGNKGDPKPGTYLRDETNEEYIRRVTDMVLDDPMAFLKREPIHPDPDEVDEVRADIWGVAKQIQESMRTGVWPRNRANDYMYNSDCQYLPVCNRETDIENPRLYTIRPRNKEDWNVF